MKTSYLHFWTTLSLFIILHSPGLTEPGGVPSPQCVPYIIPPYHQISPLPTPPVSFYLSLPLSVSHWSLGGSVLFSKCLRFGRARARSGPVPNKSGSKPGWFPSRKSLKMFEIRRVFLILQKRPGLRRRRKLANCHVLVRHKTLALWQTSNSSDKDKSNMGHLFWLGRGCKYCREGFGAVCCRNILTEHGTNRV